MLSRRRILSILSILFLSQATGCMMYLAEARVDFSKSLDFAGIQKVCVETRNGAIDINCDAGRTNVDIQATKFSRGATVEDARQYAEDIEIDAERDPEHPDTLRIVAHWPHDEPMRSRGTSFRLIMPRDAALQLRTSNGHIGAARTARDVDAETSNGRIIVTDAGGPVRAHTSNGGVTLTTIAGDVDAHTSNGSIQIDRAGKASVRAVTSNGSIHAFQTSGNAYVRTSNGTVELRLAALPQRPEVTAISSNGRVLVEAPSQVSARLRMRTSNGGVHADLKDATPLRDLDTGRSHFYATLNEGVGTINIESSNGSVTFRTHATVPQAGSRPERNG